MGLSRKLWEPQKYDFDLVDAVMPPVHGLTVGKISSYFWIAVFIVKSLLVLQDE